MLVADNIKVCYEEHVALSDFSLRVGAGEVLTIIGPNGSGKSTALRAMARILPCRAGRVFLDGCEMRHMRSRAVARRLAFVAQSQGIPPDMTVRELVGRGRTPHHSLFSGLTRADREAIEETLEMTHLTAFADRSIYSLSGGERQRTFIALALAQRPAILLLDEPTTYLDISFQFEVLELIRGLNRARNLTIVMVLHDINQAARYSDRIAVLKDGRMVKVGTPWEIVTEDMIRAIYGMRARVIREETTGCPYLIPIQMTGEGA